MGLAYYPAKGESKASDGVCPKRQSKYDPVMFLHINWRRWLPWAGVLLMVAAVSQPLWNQPLPYGDDLRLHIYRIPLIHSLWANGIPFARWMPFLVFGYGSPLFLFYPPLSAYLLTGFYWLVGQNALTAVSFFFTLCLLLGAVSMFGLGRHLFGAGGGLLAAAFYTWSPHLVYQTYARGSLSNALALAIVPLAAWGLLRVVQRPSLLRIILAAAALTLLLLAHTAVSLLFLGPLVILALTAVFLSPRREWLGLLWAVGAAFLLGLGAAAFSWLPALVEVGATRYTAEADRVAFTEAWATGFAWPEPIVAEAHNPTLPKTPGSAQIVLGAMGTVVALVGWRRRWGMRVVYGVTAVCGLMGLGVLLLALPISTAVWQRVVPLQALQFPWRLLDIPLFALSLAAGILLHPALPAFKVRLMVALVGLVVTFAQMIPTLYPPRIHTLPVQPTLADVTAVQQQYGIYGLTAWGEYSATTVTQWPAGPPFPQADTAIPLTAKLLLPPEGITAVNDDSNFWQATWRTAFTVPQTVTLAVHNFPGWQAQMDGSDWPVGNTADGRLLLAIPAGEHEVRLAFGRTPIRWLADGWTAVSVLALFFGLLWSIRHSVRIMTAPPSPARADGVVFLLVGTLLLLFCAKLLWIDRVSSPLVLYPENGRIPNTTTPEPHSFAGEIRLAGYRLTPSNQVTLYWEALTTPTHRYATALTLHNALGAPLKTWVDDAPGYTVTTNWEPGQLTRQVVTLPLAEFAAPAGFLLTVGLIETEQDTAVPLDSNPNQTGLLLGRLKNPPPQLDLPPNSAAEFGQTIALHHVDYSPILTVGAPWEVTLIWQTLATPPEDYTVFLHLYGADGSLAAGQDVQPLGGLYPTSFWQPGEQIVDGRSWLVDVSPGTYQLGVGLYRLADGVRLPLADGADMLRLGEIIVQP